MTPGHRERADQLAAMDLRGTRVACGITLPAIAAALSRAAGQHVPASTVQRREAHHRVTPRGAAGAAYWRVISGLAAHLEVPES